MNAHCIRIPLLLLFAYSLYVQGTSLPKSDSAAGRTTPAATAGEEDLIFEDGDNSILPAEIKKAAPPLAPPAAKSSADTASKKTVSQADTISGKKGPPDGGPVVPPPPAPAMIKDTAIKTTDEELILEGGEEDLLGKEKTFTAKKRTTVEEIILPDSARATQEEPPPAAGTGKPLLPPATDLSEADTGAPLPAATIEKAHSINFARNLKEYRSPKLAMLMSFVLPGSGQIYAKSNLWAVTFGAIEAALVTTGLIFSSKASKIKKNAHSFADQHYDTAAFKQYTDDLKQFLPTIYITDSNPAAKADTVYRLIFNNSKEDEAFLQAARYRNDSYYDYLELGASSPFIRGWDDVEPPFSSDGYDTTGYSAYFSIDTSLYLVCDKSDNNKRVYGTSAHLTHYKEILRDSHRWADLSLNTFLSLLINHLASSVMAGIAAKRHNDELLGKESLWQHIDIQHRYVYSGSGMAPGYALEVSF